MQLNKRILGAGSILAAAGRIALNYESTAYKDNRDVRTSTTAKGEIEPLMAKIAAVAPDHVDMIKSRLIEHNNNVCHHAKEELKVLRNISTAERLTALRAIRDMQKKKFSAKIGAKDIEHMLSRYGIDARDISVDHGIIKWTTSVKNLGVTYAMTISINTHTDTLHVTSDGLHSSRNTPPLRYTTRSGLMDNLSVLISCVMQQIGGRNAGRVATAGNRPAELTTVNTAQIEAQTINWAGPLGIPMPPEGGIRGVIEPQNARNMVFFDGATVDAALGVTDVIERAQAPVPPPIVPPAPDTNQPDEMFDEE